MSGVTPGAVQSMSVDPCMMTRTHHYTLRILSVGWGRQLCSEWGRGEETPRPLLGQPHLQDMDRTRPLGLTGRAHRQLQAGEAADNWHLPARGRSSATTPPGSGGDLRACAPRATLSNQGRVSP